MYTYDIMKQSILSKTPWRGLFSLVGMMAILITSAVVVAISHNSPTASWPVQPAVLLAILSSLSGLLFACALDTGVAVRFWLGASTGTTLSQLHYIWDHGRGFGIIPAVRAGSQARTVALLATTACVMQFMASPLLQRSTYQALRDHVTYESMSMDIAARIPDGWFGPRAEPDEGLFERRNGLSETQQWWRKAPILTRDQPGYGCDGVCDASVFGVGFSYECWSEEQKLDLSTAATDDQTVFSMVLLVMQNTTSEPFLLLRTKYLSEVDSNCIGTIQASRCNIKAATVQYPVTIQNTTVSLRSKELLNMTAISPYSSPGDFTDAPMGSPAGPLVGLTDYVYNILVENTTKEYDAELNRTTYGGMGNLADVFFVPPDRNHDPSPSMCRLKFTPPEDYALTVMYEFMFRFALAAGSGKETQTFTARRTVPELVYQADPSFLAVSLVAMACAIVLVGTLNWNWWRLGRPVTLSPLETAAALGRPILEDRPHATVDEILAETRGMKSELVISRSVAGSKHGGCKCVVIELDEKGGQGKMA